MSNVLVTGGNGYIGSHSVLALIDAGHNPVIIDNLDTSKPYVHERLEELANRKIAFYKEDIANSTAVRTILEKESIDSVIHFAAYMSVSESVKEPLKYYINNVTNFTTLLANLTDYGIQNFVFSSSCTVYGSPESSPVTEEAAIQKAVSPYGATKQINETILCDTVAASDNLHGLALRYFNPIGAHPSGRIGEDRTSGKPSQLLPYLLQSVTGKQPPLVVHGTDYPTPDGTCIRDYIHVTDLAIAHVKAMEFLAKQPGKTYDVFNIGTGTGSSVLQVIEAFERVNSVQVPHTFGSRRPGDAVAVYADPTKAKRKLGWEAKLTLDDAVRDAWVWQQSLDD